MPGWDGWTVSDTRSVRLELRDYLAFLAQFRSSVCAPVRNGHLPGPCLSIYLPATGPVCRLAEDVVSEACGLIEIAGLEEA